ncbi:MAG: hypothetical protein AAF485_06905 [Chloroflexota bacterium]
MTLKKTITIIFYIVLLVLLVACNQEASFAPLLSDEAAPVEINSGDTNQIDHANNEASEMKTVETPSLTLGCDTGRFVDAFCAHGGTCGRVSSGRASSC